jgi:hypothetical protein
MEDIDLFIKRLQEEQEIKDFLEKNIYPKSLSKCLANPYRMEKFPELKPLKSLDFEIQNIENIDIKNTFDKLNIVENQIKEMIQRENKDNCCPICLDQFKPTSYFMPNCGHKICLHCFTNNMIKNKSTGGYCCLCREKMIPNI